MGGNEWSVKKVAIIQARMGSTRLPGKVLKRLAGVPVIRQVYSRVRRIPELDEVVVATTRSSKDDVLVAYCEREGIRILRGSEDDVLDRYYQAARVLKAEVVMRITADCPFIDPRVSHQVLKLLIDDPDCEYATNALPRTFPDGLDTEVVRMDTLARIWGEVSDPRYREHVTYYISTHPDRFRVRSVVSPVDYSHHRWTLDCPEDYEVLSRIAEVLRRRGQFGYLEEILAILDERPEIAAINRHLRCNEAVQELEREK